MTDKEQIMIDGCNVSECLFYQSNFEEDYDVKIKHFCSNWHNSCESANNSNCYFKQLARKTQECKQLKEDYAELEQECERLKSYGATLLADKNAMEIGRDDYMQRCKRLEQECEELKRKVERTGRMKKFIYETLLNFVEYLIKKFNINDEDILYRYQKLKNEK